MTQTLNDAPDDPLEQLLKGTARTVTINPDARMLVDEQLAGVGIFSGAFNPLHDGHIRLAHVAAETLRIPVLFELPIINADKAPIHYIEICRRISQFGGLHKIVLTRTPLFHQKSSLFPKSVFVIGFDTVARIVKHSYYGGDESGMLAAFEAISVAGCRFLVAGRLWRKEFHGLQDVEIPTRYEHLFQSLSEDQFRVDIASTTMRQMHRRS